MCEKFSYFHSSICWWHCTKHKWLFAMEFNPLDHSHIMKGSSWDLISNYTIYTSQNLGCVCVCHGHRWQSRSLVLHYRPIPVSSIPKGGGISTYRSWWIFVLPPPPGASHPRGDPHPTSYKTPHESSALLPPGDCSEYCAPWRTTLERP